jgi:hypothetical protein
LIKSPGRGDGIHLKMKDFHRPGALPPVLDVTGDSAAARLAPAYFPGVPLEHPVLRQSRLPGPTAGFEAISGHEGAEKCVW